MDNEYMQLPSADLTSPQRRSLDFIMMMLTDPSKDTIADFLEHHKENSFDMDTQLELEPTVRGVTPLLALIRNRRRLNMVEKELAFILDRGADPNKTYATACGQHSAMSLAILQDDLVAVRFMVERYKWDMFSKEASAAFEELLQTSAFASVVPEVLELYRQKQITRIVNEPPSGDLKPMIVFPKLRGT